MEFYCGNVQLFWLSIIGSVSVVGGRGLGWRRSGQDRSLGRRRRRCGVFAWAIIGECVWGCQWVLTDGLGSIGGESQTRSGRRQTSSGSTSDVSRRIRRASLRGSCLERGIFDEWVNNSKGKPGARGGRRLLCWLFLLACSLCPLVGLALEFDCLDAVCSMFEPTKCFFEKGYGRVCVDSEFGQGVPTSIDVKKLRDGCV